jgi:hypothetical protein
VGIFLEAAHLIRVVFVRPPRTMGERRIAQAERKAA